MKGLYDRLGITYDFVEKGPNALFFSDYQDFTPEQWKRFRANHWEGFDMWLRDVAVRRHMTYEQATNLALGRVWSGRQAKENGLVDELGGLDRAVEVAKELAKIPAEEKVTVVHYPKRKGFLELILSSDGGIGTIANWVVYRYIKDDLAETWNTLNRSDLHLTDVYRE
jgi:protease-4